MRTLRGLAVGVYPHPRTFYSTVLPATRGPARTRSARLWPRWVSGRGGSGGWPVILSMSSAAMVLTLRVTMRMPRAWSMTARVTSASRSSSSRTVWLAWRRRIVSAVAACAVKASARPMSWSVKAWGGGGEEVERALGVAVDRQWEGERSGCRSPGRVRRSPPAGLDLHVGYLDPGPFLDRRQAGSASAEVLDLVHAHRGVVTAHHRGDLAVAAQRDAAVGAGHDRGRQRGELLEEVGDVGAVEDQVLQLGVRRRGLDRFRRFWGPGVLGVASAGRVPACVHGPGRARQRRRRCRRDWATHSEPPVLPSVRRRRLTVGATAHPRKGPRTVVRDPRRTLRWRRRLEKGGGEHREGLPEPGRGRSVAR